MCNELIAGLTRDELVNMAQSCETAIADAFLKALGARRVRRRKGRKKHHDRRYRHAKKLMSQKYGVRL